MNRKILMRNRKRDSADMEYFKKNLFNALKIPPKYFGLKEDKTIGVKSLEITKNEED
jgi:hypothetical protein